MKDSILEDLHRDLLLLQRSITIVQTDESDGIVSKPSCAFRWSLLVTSLNQISLRCPAGRNTLLLNLDDGLRQGQGLQKEVRVESHVHGVEHYHCGQYGLVHELQRYTRGRFRFSTPVKMTGVHE